MLSVLMIVYTICSNIVTLCFLLLIHLKTLVVVSISSKKRVAGNLSKRCLSLDKKIKILHEAKKRRKISCREVSAKIKIGKTKAANVEACLRVEYENFKDKGYEHIQRRNHHRFKAINNTMCEKCPNTEFFGLNTGKYGPKWLKKERKLKVAKNRSRGTVAIFVSADGGNVEKTIVIWKSKNP